MRLLDTGDLLAAERCAELPPLGFVCVVGGALLALALGELRVVQRVVGGIAIRLPGPLYRGLTCTLSGRATGSIPFSRTLTRRPMQAMRSVHVKA